MKIFLSYSHYDKEIASYIQKNLIEKKHEVWIDQVKIKQGDNIAEKINKGIEQAEIIILLIVNMH